MTDLKEFTELLKNNKIKFTPPQQKIVNKILEGYQIIVVNQHRMNGGEMMWMSPNSNEPQYAGTIYKAFQGVSRSIRKVIGKEISMGFAISPIKNMRF